VKLRDYEDYSVYGRDGAASVRRPGMLHYALAGVSGALLLAAAAPLLLFWISLIVSDATLPLQFIAFVPKWIWVVAAIPPFLGALVIRPRAIAGHGRLRRRLGIGCAIVLGISGGYVLFIDWRMFNALRSRPEGAALSIAYWNLTMPDSEHWDGSLPDAVGVGRGDGVSGVAPPEVYLLTSNQTNAAFDETLRKLRTDGKTWNVVRRGEFVAISLLPIVSTRLHRLQSVGTVAGTMEDRQRWEDFYNRWVVRIGVRARTFNGDSAAEVFEVEVDATASLGKVVRFWLIDLPSDPMINRRAAALAVREWLSVQRSVADGLGLPDVVIGDCNMPRGTRALDVVMEAAGRPVRHAFDQVGWGLAASWPKAKPLLHIDHCFVTPGLQAVSYSRVKPPVSDHWVQRVEVGLSR